MRIANSYFDDIDSAPLDIYLGQHEYYEDTLLIKLDGVIEKTRSMDRQEGLLFRN